MINERKRNSFTNLPSKGLFSVLTSLLRLRVREFWLICWEKLGALWALKWSCGGFGVLVEVEVEDMKLGKRGIVEVVAIISQCFFFFWRVGWDNEMDLALVPLLLSWCSLIHVWWWQRERERADDDFMICMVLYICISPSQFLFSYFSFVISVLLLILIVFLVWLQWLQSKLDIWTLFLFCSFWNCGYFEFDIMERCVDIFVGKLTNFWYHSLFFRNLRAPIIAEMFNCTS